MFSKSPDEGFDQRLVRYDHIIVHCTATPPNIDVDAKWVDRAHRERGFKNGCGYHAVITRKGDWQDHDGGFTTREPGFMGAHVGDCGRGWNERSFGISLAGGVDVHMKPERNFTENQMDTLEAGIEKFLSLHPDGKRVKILGHRDLIKLTGAPPKACPCFDFNDWWQLRGHVRRDAMVSKTKVSLMRGEDTRAEGNPTLVVPEWYAVNKGDTLSRIALNYGRSLDELKELNPRLASRNYDMLKIGEKIKLR